MDKKLSVPQALMIGGIITAVCKHLPYPLNLVVMVLVLLGLFVFIIKERKKYNKFNFLGMITIFIGGTAGALLISGSLKNISVPFQFLASLGMIFLGIILLGVGNHIKNPERVPKKLLYLSTVFFCIILGIFGVLFELVK